MLLTVKIMHLIWLIKLRFHASSLRIFITSIATDLVLHYNKDWYNEAGKGRCKSKVWRMIGSCICVTEEEIREIMKSRSEANRRSGMINLYDGGAYLVNGMDIIPDNQEAQAAIKAKTGKDISREEASKETIAYGILEEHNTSGNMDKLKIKFDKLTSHDITFVGIIQTARASGLEKFPMPYVLTNCHNSLCAVGGTINEDDHMFGLTCAKKYGGVYVPPHQAVIHQYAREMLAGGGRMILGSDSHTRYGALGTMAMGEGGPELVKQLLNQTYDINMPGVVGIYLTGEPVKGVGPQDVALAIIGAVFGDRKSTRLNSSH